MNLDSDFLAILFHRGPIFCDGGLRLHQLIPCHRRAMGRHFDHRNAMIHRTDIEAESAAYAIDFAHNWMRTRGRGFDFSVTFEGIFVWLHKLVGGIDEVDALMRGVVAGDVTEVALDALALIDARDGTKGKIEILEV